MQFNYLSIYPKAWPNLETSLRRQDVSYLATREAYVSEISFAMKQDKTFTSGHKCFLPPVPELERKWMNEDIKGLFTLCEGRANMWEESVINDNKE